MSDTVSDLLKTSEVIICAGSGGVGKTTMSATLAIKAAMAGKRAIVITIDPAKRLATSLGLQALSSTPTDLTESIDRELKARGEPPCKGRFFAVMPDTAQTFESFVRTMAGKNQNIASRVLRTSIYKIFAKEFSGTNEYMATARLYELYTRREYDLIVLDTPPSANTRMFLEAPRLLGEFFDDRIIKWFVAPGARLFAGGVRKMLQIMERVTGRGFIAELLEFTGALFELRNQFRENLRVVDELFHKKGVAFIVVTSPERLSKQDTQEFVEMISSRRYRLWGFIVNRTLSERLGAGLGAIETGQRVASVNDLVEEWATELKAGAKNAETELLRKTFEPLVPQLEHEADAFRFLDRLGDRRTNIVLVPEQQADVHSVGALVDVSRQLG